MWRGNERKGRKRAGEKKGRRQGHARMEGMKANGEMAGMETRQGHGVGSAGGGWSLGESPRERKMGVGAAAGVAQAMCEGEEAWIERGAGPWATMGWTINGAPRVLWGAFDWGAWDGLTTVAQRDEVHEAGRADTRPFGTCERHATCTLAL